MFGEILVKEQKNKRSEKFAEGEKRVQGRGYEWKMGNVAQSEHAGLGLNAVRRHQSARLIRGEGGGNSVHARYLPSYGITGTSIQITLPNRTGRKISDEDHAHFVTRTNRPAIRIQQRLDVLVRATRAYKTMEAIKGQKRKEKESGWQAPNNKQGTDGRPLHLHSILLVAALMYVLSLCLLPAPKLVKFLFFFSPLLLCSYVHQL